MVCNKEQLFVPGRRDSISFIDQYDHNLNLKQSVEMDWDMIHHGLALTETGSVLFCGTFFNEIQIGDFPLNNETENSPNIFISKIDNHLVGLPKVEEEEGLKIYPNPTTDFLRIETPELKGDVQLTLYNSLGKRVLSLMKSPGVSETMSLDLRLYTKGIYLLELTSDQGTISQRVVRY